MEMHRSSKLDKGGSAERHLGEPPTSLSLANCAVMSESDGSTTSAAGGAAMSDAQRRAAARKAKILARGGAGLAKLANTARGEEGSLLYDSG